MFTLLTSSPLLSASEQEKPEIIEPLFRGFVLSFCQNDESDRQPVDVLRYVVPSKHVKHVTGVSNSQNLLKLRNG